MNSELWTLIQLHSAKDETLVSNQYTILLSWLFLLRECFEKNVGKTLSRRDYFHDTTTISLIKS